MASGGRFSECDDLYGTRLIRTTKRILYNTASVISTFPLSTQIGTQFMASSLPTGKPYSRLDDFPLDDSTLFETLAAAKEYAENSPIAYHTQIIGVTDEDKVYMIAEDRSLIPLTGGGGGDGEDATIEEDVTLLGTHLGGLEDGATIPEGTTFTEFVKMVSQKRIAPTYTVPSLSLSGTGTKTVEAGTSIVPTLTAIFMQNDGGEITEYKVQKNGEDIFTNGMLGPFTEPSAVIEDETWTFRASATYGAGAIKNDNMGQAAPDGAIDAGTISSGNVVYTGKRNLFYDADTETEAAETSEEIRALSNSILGPTNSEKWSLIVPAGSQRITIAYPATLRDLSNVAYVEQGNAEYKDLFVKSEVEVEGAGEFTAIAYKVFTYITAVPTPAAMTLNVTV